MTETDGPVFERARVTWGDCARYFIALFVAQNLFFLAVSLTASAAADEGFDTTTLGDVLVSLLWEAGLIAGAVLLGHALPSLVRGRVSLTLSSLLTWVALAVLYGGINFVSGDASWDEMTSMVLFSALVLVPVMIAAHVLRLLVPVLRPRVDGRPVQYVMSGAAR